MNLEKTILTTGGAPGSDITWEEECLKRNLEVRSYSFKGHKSLSKNPIILTDEELKLADPFLIEANKTLKRWFPTKTEYINNLLRRNYYQIKDVDCVIAIGKWENPKGPVKGGTGWAVQMAIDLSKQVFLFEQIENKWFLWSYIDKEWVETKPDIRTVSISHSSCIHINDIGKGWSFAGIGTRELWDNGKEAIKQFCKMNFSVK